MKIVWLIAGWALVGIGLVGVVLPILPTTIFLILAAGCFARSSPRLEAWILTHPRFGPAVAAWRDNGAMPAYAKRAAFLGLIAGFALLAASHLLPAVALALAAFGFLAIGYWIAARPEPDGLSRDTDAALTQR